MSVYTRPDPSQKPEFSAASLSQQPAPGLIFQKWQAWDDFDKFDRKDARPGYLRDIAAAVHAVYQNQSAYPVWHQRYIAALTALGIDNLKTYRTVWRLIVGWGSNPALEAGLTLHHLYGFPYIPGSAVKGLLHHCAELETMEMVDLTAAKFKEDQPLPLDKDPDAWLDTLISRLCLIKVIFGSLHLEKAEVKHENSTLHLFGEECPKPLLEVLKRKLDRQAGDLKKHRQDLPDSWKKIDLRLEYLLEENAGSLVRFYDAVPKPDQDKLLQTDIVNCHYSEYYSDTDLSHPPSDDQQPIPVTFLAVRPGAAFQFPFRIARWPSCPARDEEEQRAWDALQDKTPDEIHCLIEHWLEVALTTWGIGAKTAAGYGYFKPV